MMARVSRPAVRGIAGLVRFRVSWDLSLQQDRNVRTLYETAPGRAPFLLSNTAGERLGAQMPRSQVARKPFYRRNVPRDIERVKKRRTCEGPPVWYMR